MKLQPVNIQNQKPNFKSAYPVTHWIAETNGSYASIGNLNLIFYETTSISGYFRRCEHLRICR